MNLKGFEQSLTAFLSARHWYIAYSGGLDSHLLLILSQQVLLNAAKNGIKNLPDITAIHINHQLQDAAEGWVDHCRVTCKKLSIPIIVETVDIQDQGNIEEQARLARLSVFKKHLQGDDVLFLGHHQDDQIETFFYRLLRGTGIKGLAAMAAQRHFDQSLPSSGLLVRPMLVFSRAELKQEALQRGLQWIEDGSNDDARYDRNYLRLEVLPRLKSRWPAFAASISRLTRHLQEHQQLLEEVAVDDLLLCEPCYEHFWQEHSLAITPLQQFSSVRRKNIIRHWSGTKALVLSDAHMQLLLQAITAQKTNQKFVLQLAGKALRIFNNRLYLCCADLQWQTTVKPIQWNGLQRCHVVDVMSLSLMMPLALNLTVKWREGGERGRLPGNKQHKSLKNILQEAAVPYWRRPCLPLIYSGDCLIAVADMILMQEGLELLGPDNKIVINRPVAD
ncbi:MAG: tRNA lysidine(34) synthetase TilS [Pseudomonadales bacterium]|nr:tRNA lysidine(34) synthetase TilS [Pseudomonadales bacterium]